MNSPPSERLARLGAFVGIALVLAAADPAASRAQTTFEISGVVVDARQGSPVPLATVELDDGGSTLTFQDGSYGFPAVAAGAYNLRVSAYGYLPVTRTIVVDGDLSIVISLEPAPVVLDSLSVAPAVINIGGQVRDPANDFAIIEAELLTNQGHVTHTNTHGRFRVENVLEGVPLRIAVREFGYLPLDTTVIPVQGERHLFELHPDLAVEAMVDREVKRMEERAAPRFAPFFSNMNRDVLLRYTGRHTLRSILEFRYWRHLDRVRAVIVDGRRYNFTDDPVSELSHILPEEMQRVEFHYAGRRSVIVVVYTRDFMRELIARRTAPDR